MAFVVPKHSLSLPVFLVLIWLVEKTPTLTQAFLTLSLPSTSPWDTHTWTWNSHRHRPTQIHAHESPDNDRDRDLFEYFDPLLSPHAYPNGISPDHAPLSEQELENQKTPSARRSRQSFGFRLLDEQQLYEGVENVKSSRPTETSPDVFDPLLSPHSYPTGVPDVVIGFEHVTTKSTSSNGSQRESISTDEKNRRRKVGILLIDHGSRNKESNERLHQLAQIYQEQYGSSDTVVRAAHMEFAQPTIPDALQALIEETGNGNTNSNDSLDEIICHPFFLSPMGRHVSEDIPRIIEAAKKDLSIDIPITLTEPVGAETSVIMQAVHSLIQQSKRTSTAKM
ncbi:hypothetical protein ACA910_003168 [Epithemia clementina (nom. ined.)]